jgi:hypothetical protein
MVAETMSEDSQERFEVSGALRDGTTVLASLTMGVPSSLAIHAEGLLIARMAVRTNYLEPYLENRKFLEGLLRQAVEDDRTDCVRRDEDGHQCGACWWCEAVDHFAVVKDSSEPLLHADPSKEKDTNIKGKQP